MIKSYSHKINLNKEKQHYIENVLYPEWIRVAGILMKAHMNYFYKNNCIHTSNKVYQPIKTFLTERYKDSINRQVVGIFKSKISNFKTRYVKIVMSGDLPDELKKDLCLVNKRNLFFTNVDLIGKNYVVSKESIKLGRWIFKNFFGKLPSCKHINISLNPKIATIEELKSSTHNDFKYMIRLTKGNKNIRGEFIYIPVCKNPYCDKIIGKLNTSCNLIFEKGKLKEVSLTKDIENIKPELNHLKITFDIGLNILIATNKGDCYGKSYMKKLKKLDLKLMGLQNKLKEIHGKKVKLTEFKEYNDLVQKIRDFSKNEINRIINKIYKKYKPKTIVVEDLDFKCSDLRKTTNRLLSRFGLGYITKKLKQLELEFGVDIVYVDPAYSSQTCNKCYYIDSKNRKTQSKFKCLCCGKEINADVNGSRTVGYFAERFGKRQFYGNKGRDEKRTLLVSDFISSKVWLNDRRIIQIMKSNPYFKDFEDLFREKLLS